MKRGKSRPRARQRIAPHPRTLLDQGRARDGIASGGRALLPALVATAASVVAMVTVPAIAGLFHVAPLDALAWAAAISGGALGAVAMEPLRRLVVARSAPAATS